MVMLIGLALLIIIGYFYYLFVKGDIPLLMRNLRWLLGGGGLLLAALLALGGRLGIASLLVAAGGSILARGQLGPIDFKSYQSRPGQKSRVKSRYFDMQLDHDNGEVIGRAIAGKFSGKDLIELDEQDTRELFAEIAGDADSIALLETWLDANRSGWREYFAGKSETDGETNQHSDQHRATSEDGPMTDAQARDILGLSESAGEDEIKAAHKRLLRAVHPDQGGSSFLAARINAARDQLLKKHV